jgi:septum formation protein
MIQSPNLQYEVPLILASASPRRRGLLLAAGIACEVDAVDVDERRAHGEGPDAYVRRVARLKAEAGAARHPGRIVLAADTVVVLGAEVLGKPTDDEDAARMLARLSGRSHEVLTAVALARQDRTFVELDRTTVWMDAVTPDDITWYVASGEPRDKAGAYAIQGLAARFIPRIEGSWTNVVGLPIATVHKLLKLAGAAA